MEHKGLWHQIPWQWLQKSYGSWLQLLISGKFAAHRASSHCTVQLAAPVLMPKDTASCSAYSNTNLGGTPTACSLTQPGWRPLAGLWGSGTNVLQLYSVGSADAVLAASHLKCDCATTVLGYGSLVVSSRYMLWADDGSHGVSTRSDQGVNLVANRATVALTGQGDH